MKTWLKKIVPLEARTRIKWVGYALRDVFDPVTASRDPPWRKNFIGGGDFELVGGEFFKTLKRHGLKANMQVLECGCGQGRMARPLVPFLTTDGSYKGFDIVKAGVEWCEQNYKDAPNFDFIHANIYNKRYNTTGSISAAEYQFPYSDAEFDLTFLTSVFTHMFADDVENYMSEISRSLKPGGIALITWFLLNDVSRKTKHHRFQFKFNVDEVSKTTVSQNPEAAIAFEEDYVRGLYDTYGFEIVDIERGTWGYPDSQFDLQDLVVARKL